MDKKLPIYRMVLDPEKEDSGIDFIALVDEPAIQTHWFVFKKEEQLQPPNTDHKFLFKADSDRKIIVSPAMIPDLPIYRRNEQMGEFYVIFDKQQINLLQEKFMEKNFINNINVMHDDKQQVSGVFMKNSWVSDSTMGIKPPDMFSDLPDGTWFISYKFKNEDMWQKFVKEGEFKGVSVEGMFDLVPYKKTFEEQFLEIVNQITQD